MNASIKTPKELAKEIEKNTQCTCNLDKWEPEHLTGHSFVCDIHKRVMDELRKRPYYPPVK